MESIVSLHRYIAYSIPTGWALLTLWSAFVYLSNREAGDLYWRLLALMQVILGIQIVVGLSLLVTGHSLPSGGGPRWLHLVYGGIGPLIVLLYAHRYAARRQDVAIAIFGLAAFLCFGLTFRALQTGLGWMA